MAISRVVVLGGGVGGMVAASELKKRLADEVAVTLIDKTCEQILGASQLEMMVGRRDKDSAIVNVRDLAKKGVEVVCAEATWLSTEQRTVQCAENGYAYDYLIVALGARLAPEKIRGLTEASETYYTADGAVKLNAALKEFSGGRIAIVVSSLPYKCPAAPYEGAFLMDAFLRERGVRDKSFLDIYTPEPQPMPSGGEAVRAPMLALLGEREITFHPKHTLAQVDAATKRLVFKEETEADYDLLVAIPPHVPPDIIVHSELAGPNGWIPVDRVTLKTQKERIWAIGDVNGISLGEGRSLPKAAVFAEAEAIAVVSQIVADMRGDAAEPFHGLGACYIDLGDHRAAYAEGSFFVEGGAKFTMQPPSAELFTAKEHWIQEWIERWRM